MKRHGIIIATIASGFYCWIVAELINQYLENGYSKDSLVVGLVFYGILVGVLSLLVFEFFKERKERNNKPILYKEDYE